MSPRQVLITRYEDLEEMHIPFGGLRENIIIKGSDAQSFKPGAMMQIGEAKLKLTFYCEPCKRIEDIVPSIPAVFHKRGILAVVIEGGTISLQDEVTITSNFYAPLSENPTERFLAFVQMIPKGKIVTYKTVARAMGVAEGFIRAMPGYIKRADQSYPTHRIIDEEGNLIIKHIPDQKELLVAEGVHINPDDSIDLNTYLRNDTPLYLD